MVVEQLEGNSSRTQSGSKQQFSQELTAAKKGTSNRGLGFHLNDEVSH